MKKKPDDANVEVTSTQLLNELIEIKDRVGALENVAGIANQEILVKFFREVLNSSQKREIAKACEEPQSRSELMTKFNFKSPQALNHHLKPLRESLIHETHVDGQPLYEWGLLFKRLQKKSRESLLNEKEDGKK